MRIRNSKDLSSGAIFLAVGFVFGASSLRYELGALSEMGPGYFPLLLSCLLAAIGLALCAKGLARGGGREHIAPWPWRAIVAILSAVVLFALFLTGAPSIGLPTMGLVPAVYLLTCITALAGTGAGWRGTLVLGSILAAFSYAVFIVILKLPMSAWPGFLSV